MCIRDRPAGRPLHSPHPDRLHRHPPLPGRSVSHCSGQHRRRAARCAEHHGGRQSPCGQCAAAGCCRDHGAGAGDHGLNRLSLLFHNILLIARPAAQTPARRVWSVKTRTIRRHNDQKCAPRSRSFPSLLQFWCKGCRIQSQSNTGELVTAG